MTTQLAPRGPSASIHRSPRSPPQPFDESSRVPRPAPAKGSGAHAGWDVTDALARWLLVSPLLRSLDTEQLRHLCATSHVIHAAMGESVFRRDDKAASVFLVVEGEIELSNGGTRKAGDLLGEFGLVSAGRRVENATACSMARLVALPAASLRNYLFHSRSRQGSMVPALIEQLAKAAMRRCALFDALPEDALARLAKRAELECFKGDQVISQAGVSDETICFVLSGHLTWTEAHGGHVLATGEISQGQAIQIERGNPAQDIRGRGRSWLLRLRRHDIVKASETAPAFARRFGLLCRPPG